MPKKLCGSVRWSWHRKDGAPKEVQERWWASETCCLVRCFRHRNDGVAKKLCGSVRWPRHRKDGAPNLLVV